MTPYTPEQNGVAERLNRTLTTKIRAMLSDSGAPIELWGEAAYTACYLYNRTARDYGDKHATPEEIWTGEKPDIFHLRVFGCVAYTQFAKEQRGKLDSTSMRGIFVGYTPTSRQYRVYDPARKIVKQYSTVHFEEIWKGGTLADSQKGPNNLRIEGEEIETEDPEQNDIGDTIIVRARTPPQPEPPEAQSERIEDASEELT